METRPTSDRLRETLFDVLAPRIEGASFADLYAGSGAIGIEALSRGAREVVFIENAPQAVAAIRANLATLGIEQGFNIETRSTAAAIKRRAGRPDAAFDLVVLDPPYAASEEYGQTLALLGTFAEKLLAPDAIVVAEHARRIDLKEHYEELVRYRVLNQGDARLSFYRIEKARG